MREKLKEFYEFSKDDNLISILSSDKTLFVFDTNSLLELYSINFKHAEVILNILKDLGDKVWIPYQVGFEFQKNRLKKITERRKAIKGHIKDLDNLSSSIQSISNNKLFKHDQELTKKIQKITDELNPKLNNIKDLIQSELDNSINVRSEDNIRSELDQIFCGNRIGDRLSKEKLEKVIKEAETRLENKNCPGYKDNNKTDMSYYYDFSFENKYGDFLIFNELREKLKSLNKKVNLVFITYDTKEDWWEVIDHEGKKPIGPAIYIKQELLYCPETKLKNLAFLTLDDFLDNLPNENNEGTTIKTNIVEELRENTTDRLKDLIGEYWKSKTVKTNDFLEEDETGYFEHSKNIETYRKDFRKIFLNKLMDCPEERLSYYIDQSHIDNLTTALLESSLQKQNKLFKRFLFSNFVDFVNNSDPLALFKLIDSNMGLKRHLAEVKKYILELDDYNPEFEKFIRKLNGYNLL